ncbi:MAG: UDP-N-acetylmuramate dehydrogenase [Elusimicrobiota bacterium]
MISDAERRRILSRFSQAKFGEPMSRRTSFHIGGPADCYLELLSREDLAAAAAMARELGLPFLFIGWGSNVLVLDGGIRGMVLRLRGEFERADFLGEGRVRAGSGMRLPKLAALCAQEGLSGIEPLVGVPGTVGGALVMNAGVKGCEIGDFVLEAEIWDDRIPASRVLGKENLRFGYRSSTLGASAVLGCVLQLNAGDKVDIMKKIQEHQQKRLETQPVQTYNVGSIFRNPPDRFAARLIEEAGLKGKTLGGARISLKHANFIENGSNAEAADVLGLIRLAQAAVRKRFAVDLDLEVKIIGEA